MPGLYFYEAFRINDSPRVLPGWREVVGRFINNSGASRINDTLSENHEYNKVPLNWRRYIENQVKKTRSEMDKKTLLKICLLYIIGKKFN